MNPQTVVTPAPTPTRANARIAVQTKARISAGAKTPVYESIVLNVSMGGALIFTEAKHEQGTTIQVELGLPIMPVPRLVRGRIAHIDPAPDDVLAMLVAKGRLTEGRKGSLLGIEFISLEKDVRLTLSRFIEARMREEQERRTAGNSGGSRRRTARDRVLFEDRRHVPSWAYTLGLLTGSFILINGIISNQDSNDILKYVGLAMGGFWVTGRVAIGVWSQLEAERPPEAMIIAKTDGMTNDVEEVLADADSALDLPPEDEELIAEPAENSGATTISEADPVTALTIVS